MRETTKVTIGDVEYAIYQFPATQGLDLGIRLGKLIAPVIAPLADAADQAGIAGRAVKAAADALAANLNAKEVVAMVKELISVVTCSEGKLEDIFDAHFTGRLGSLPPLLAAVVEHNFADFFTGIVGMAGAKKTT